jgi:hypothetical protein
VSKKLSAECNASGWTVRTSSVRRDGGQDQKCPAGDHQVTAKPVKGRPGVVALAAHRTRR